MWKLTLWDESKVSPLEFLKGGYSLSVKIMTLCKIMRWVTNVYGATDYKGRRYLWPELLYMIIARKLGVLEVIST